MNTVELGREFARGVLQEISLCILCLVIVTALVNVVWNRLAIGKDATDGPSERSNLSLRVDHETGCQYLVTPDGAITPRLDREGHVMCAKGDKS